MAAALSDLESKEVLSFVEEGAHPELGKGVALHSIYMARCSMMEASRFCPTRSAARHRTAEWAPGGRLRLHLCVALAVDGEDFSRSGRIAYAGSHRAKISPPCPEWVLERIGEDKSGGDNNTPCEIRIWPCLLHISIL